MSRRQGERTGAPEIIDLNLLPESERPTEISPVTALAVVGVVLAIVAIAPLSLRMAHEKDRANAAKQQANVAEQSLHAVQVDIAQHSALQRDLAATRTHLDGLLAQRAQFQGGARPLFEDLTQLSQPDRLPTGTRLKTIAGTDVGLKVEGTAPGPLEAIAYADRLMKEAGFRGARLISFAPSGLGGQFVVEVTR